MIAIINALPLGVLALVIVRRVLCTVFYTNNTRRTATRRSCEDVSTQVRSYRNMSCQSSAEESATRNEKHKVPVSLSTNSMASLDSSSTSYCQVKPSYPVSRTASAENLLTFPMKKSSLNCPSRRPYRPCAADIHSCFPSVIPRPSCFGNTCIVSADKHAGCAQIQICPPSSSTAASQRASSENVGKKGDNYCTCILFGPCQCKKASECLPVCTADKTLSGMMSSKITSCNNKGGEYTCSQAGVRVGCICDVTNAD